MFGFVLRRLAWAIVLFLALTLYTYVLFFVIPGNNETIRRGFRVDQGTTLRETVGIDGGSIVRSTAPSSRTSCTAISASRSATGSR